MCRSLAIVIVLAASPALAEPTADEKAEAARLFDEGRTLATQEGKFAQACEKFTKSLELDHAAGTELNLGDCHEHLGHLAESWRWFSDAAAQFERDHETERANFAHARADAVLPRLGTVIVDVADPHTPGLTVKVGNRIMKNAQEITEHVDPGSVEVNAVAAGQPAFDRAQTVAAGETITISVVFVPDTRGDAVDSNRTVRRPSRVVAAYTLGAVGGAGVVTSVLIALVAKSHYNDAIKSCTKGADGTYTCDTGPYAQAHDAGTLANVATGIGAVGLALVAAGAVVYVTAPRDVVVAPTASAQGGGLSISGRF